MSFHKLDSDQKLFDGSNPILAELYRRTAERLNEIMDAVGGPGRTISSTFQLRPQLIHSLRPCQKVESAAESTRSVESCTVEHMYCLSA